MAKPYQEGKGWAVRQRVLGQDLYLSGYPTEGAARKAAEEAKQAILKTGKPSGAGPHKTTLGQAIQRYGLERLAKLKGARQDAGRLNKYLRAAGLQTLKLERLPEGQGTYWQVSLKAEDGPRRIPASLQAHRESLLEKSATSDEYA